jgi:hypothetical protein
VSTGTAAGNFAQSIRPTRTEVRRQLASGRTGGGMTRPGLRLDERDSGRLGPVAERSEMRKEQPTASKGEVCPSTSHVELPLRVDRLSSSPWHPHPLRVHQGESNQWEFKLMEAGADRRSIRIDRHVLTCRVAGRPSVPVPRTQTSPPRSTERSELITGSRSLGPSMAPPGLKISRSATTMVGSQRTPCRQNGAGVECHTTCFERKVPATQRVCQLS